MRQKLVIAAITAIIGMGVAGSASAQCPTGYVCATGVPMFEGTGPNCYRVTMPSDNQHVYAVIFNETSTLAGDALMLALQSGTPIEVLAQTTSALCNLNVGSVLAIKGVSPAS